MIEIREIRENDAEEYLALGKTLDQETIFRMLEPGERTMTVEDQRRHIHSILGQDNSTILVALCDERIVGSISARGGQYRRERHTIYIVIAILQAFVGQGIGTRLFAELEAWARNHNIHRMELTVMVNNPRGIALYRKMGFQIEGTKRDSLLVNGEYIDEYYMAKLL